MPAHNDTISTLYLNICNLAYSETQLAISPRLPFQVSDRTALVAQATQIADEAKRIRQKSPSAMSQSAVDAASASVGVARSIFNIVTMHTGNTYTTVQIFDCVSDAIAAVRNV